jgi:fluoroacetyl-CoA thioesterase
MKRRAAKPRKRSSRPAKKAKRGGKISRAAPAGMPRLGLESAVQRVVPREWTIAAFDPRLPAVLSTPAMIGMMEIAAAQAVQPELPAGALTVGTRIEVDHLKAVTEGATVRAAARLVGYRGRFLVFEVEARSGDLVLGRGKVYRAIIEPQTFNARATARTDS